MWDSSPGKTAAANLNAGIFREIVAKESHARFKKAGRGVFAVRKANPD